MRTETRNALIYLTFLAWSVVTAVAVIRHHALNDVCACEREGRVNCACFERTFEDRLKKTH